MDADVLTLAQRIAEVERRSVTAVFEVAVIEYAERRGITLDKAKPQGAAE